MTSSPACGARTARRSAPGPARQSAWVCRRGPSSELSSHAAVDFVLDLLQGAGIAAAIGIRPFLPVLLVGLLATGDLGLDFDGTDWAFLEDWWFLVLIAVLGAIDLVRDLRGARPETGSLAWLVLAPALVLAAFEGAGSLADRDHPIIPGIVVGVLAAMLGFFAARSLFGRVRGRLDAEAAMVLPL